VTRYAAALLAAVSFTFTGQPSGFRLLLGLAAANLLMHVWARVRGDTETEADA